MRKRPILSLVLVVSCFFLSAGSALAAGFALYEWSARGLGMGGAGVALADDPSAVANNPAGITQLQGTQTMAGITAISPSVQAKVTRNGDSSERETDEFTGTPPHAYVTHQLGDHYWLGLGFYNRYGLATKWDEDWAGRYSAIYAEVKSYTLHPNLAMKVTDSLSLAVGVDVMYFEMKQRLKLVHSVFWGGNGRDVPHELDASSTGFGWTLATHYRPTDWLSMGLMYRSNISQNLHGEATSKKPSNPGARFQDSDISGTITLLDSFSGGIAVKPLKNLAIEASAIYTGWRSYESLDIDYDKHPYTGTSLTSSTKKNWHDTWRFQLGVEYGITDHIDLRAGYIYDQDPINESGDHLDYLLPANDRQLYSLGFGYNQGPMAFDLAYCYLNTKSRSGQVNVPGEFYLGAAGDQTHDIHFSNNHAHIVSVSFSYAF